MQTLRALLTGMVAILCCSTTFAEESAHHGSIRGHVFDVTGAAIAKASVFVRSSSPFEETIRLAAHTDRNGDFDLVLPDGGYDVLVTSPGFVASVQTIPVRHGKNRATRWKLQIVPCDFPGTVCDTFQ